MFRRPNYAAIGTMLLLVLICAGFVLASVGGVLGVR